MNRYEISNYAKLGKECKHNLGYWERKDYLGLGLGASSLVENVRFYNTEDLHEYLSGIIVSEREELDTTEQMEEFVFLGMRKMAGISLEEFKENFNRDLIECYGDNIKRMAKQGLVEIQDGYMKLTKEGIDVSNYVFAEILF